MSLRPDPMQAMYRQHPILLGIAIEQMRSTESLLFAVKQQLSCENCYCFAERKRENEEKIRRISRSHGTEA